MRHDGSHGNGHGGMDVNNTGEQGGQGLVPGEMSGVQGRQESKGFYFLWNVVLKSKIKTRGGRKKIKERRKGRKTENHCLEFLLYTRDKTPILFSPQISKG